MLVALHASRLLQSGLRVRSWSRPAFHTPAYRFARKRLVVDQKGPVGDLSKEYERSLAALGAEDICEPALAEALQAKIDALWRDLPEPGAVEEFPVVHVGDEDASFHPYTQCKPYHPNRDPVNLVFYGNADADRVASLFRSLDPPWIDSDIVKGTTMRVPLCATPQVSWIDRPTPGGTGEFVWSKYSLSPQGCDLKRTHVRLFEGAVDSSADGWGTWCIGSVHEEDVLPGQFEHTVIDWDGAQRQVARAFLDAPGVDCQVVAMRLQKPGEVLRAVAHDGLAAAIRLD